MKALCVLACIVIAPIAAAQDKTVRQVEREQYTKDLQLMWGVMARANARQPYRRDTPLREVNITDNEIREIQAATQAYLPSEYLNISPVVTGCTCEDGPDCKEQVYVLADAGETAKGLQLSRIREKWTVGAMQRWWLDYERLVARREKMEWPEYERALIILSREFPMCGEPVRPRAGPSTVQSTPPSK